MQFRHCVLFEKRFQSIVSVCNIHSQKKTNILVLHATPHVTLNDKDDVRMIYAILKHNETCYMYM